MTYSTLIKKSPPVLETDVPKELEQNMLIVPAAGTQANGFEVMIQGLGNTIVAAWQGEPGATVSYLDFSSQDGFKDFPPDTPKEFHVTKGETLALLCTSENGAKIEVLWGRRD